jgi:hypothetical protein
VTLRARWVALRARWVALRARWVDAESSLRDIQVAHEEFSHTVLHGQKGLHQKSVATPPKVIQR